MLGDKLDWLSSSLHNVHELSAAEKALPCGSQSHATLSNLLINGHPMHFPSVFQLQRQNLFQ